MTQEHDDQLVKEFPLLFRDRHAPMSVTAMCWGFTCDDGWFFLIHNLCKCIQSRIDLNPHLNLPQPVVVQVKEKFGTLRFYADNVDEETSGMIRFAEFLSGRICEECGKEGKVLNDNGWYVCRCPEHAAYIKNAVDEEIEG
jgi:hypothetical protein